MKPVFTEGGITYIYLQVRVEIRVKQVLASLSCEIDSKVIGLD